MRPFPLVALLLLGACEESLFAPPPKTTTCGTAEQPCVLGCELPCAARAIDLAEVCVLTLEGQLDETRRRCSFDDGSLARFEEPLASTAPALQHQTIDLTLGRKDEDPCLTIHSDPGGDGEPAALEVKVGDFSYRQELWLDERAPEPIADGGPLDGAVADAASDGSVADGGPSDGGRLRVACQGTVYEQRGAELCACGGDAGCAGLPLLKLVSMLGQTLELRLMTAGGRSTPLFTCRQ